MNCKEFEAKWQDVEDPSHLSPEMEHHRGVCRSCAELAEDLELIIHHAQQLRDSEQPPERVWKEILLQLKQGGLVQEPAAERSVRRPVPLFAWLPRFSMGMSYAAVFLLALGTVYLRSVLSPVAAPPPRAASTAAVAETLMPPNAGVGDEAFQEMIGKVSPETRPVYEANLERVNSTIHQLSTFLEDHPDDRFAQEQLVTAYEQKHHLWETLVRWEEF